MNRWEVQFAEWLQRVTVTAPSAADAILVAESLYRRRFPSVLIPDAALRCPHVVRWAGAAPAPSEAAPAPAPAPGTAPAWRGKCNVCGEIADQDNLEAAHRHEDDPRSVYYAEVPRP